MSFRLVGKLMLDSSGVALGLAKAQNAFRTGTMAIASAARAQFAAAFGAAAIAAITKSTIDFAGRLSDMSQRLKVSTDTLQEWGYAASQTGSSHEAVAAFFERLMVSRTEALEGTKESIKAFETFGITLTDLTRIPVEDLGRRIARAFQDGNPQQLIADLRRLGGRSSGELIPSFVAGMDEMATQARKTGQVMDESVIKTLDDMGDRLDRLKVRARNLFGTMLAGIINSPDKINEWVSDQLAISERLPKAYQELKPYTKMSWSEFLTSPEAAAVKRQVMRERHPYVPSAPSPPTPPDLPAPVIDASTAKAKAQPVAYRMENFDPLNRIGGFASGGNFAIIAPLERIARASEDTAENTHSLRSPIV